MSMETDATHPKSSAPGLAAADLAASVDFQALAVQMDENKELSEVS